ncbi:MAG: DUF1080 domain-containing protein [Planctomycetota bacterium]|nr:DUF1080 domain-containing protein [Planctomycetota bacterium]
MRRYLASGLQRLPLEQRWEIAKNLAAHAEDNDDPNIPFLVWYGVEPLVAADPTRALAMFGSAKLERVARFTVRRAAAEPALHEALVTHLTTFADDASLKRRLEESVKALGDQRGLAMPAAWPALRIRIEAKHDAALSKLGAQVALAFGDTTSLPELRQRMLDKSLSGAERSAALNVLIEARDPVLKDSVKELLVDAGTRTAAIRAISLFDDSVTAQVALAMYASANQDERRELIDALTSRASFASLLLDAIEDQRVKRSDLGAFAARKIESFGDPKLSERLALVWGTVKTTANDKLQRIAGLKQRLTADVIGRGDRARGREIFSRTCQQCHTLFGTGGDVGPELTGANRADLDYLLSNIVDPSGVVGQDYLSTMVWTHDERLVTGILKEETDSSLVLRTERERLVIPKSEIESRRTSEVSTMPEGLLDTLQPEEIVNLIAYLQGASQANLRATPLNTGRLFDGETLAHWRFAGDVWKAEGGEIVGRGELARNSFLASELELGDFTLEFEVKLVGDEGNSGVQFRSAVHDDGEVAGYQADIGPGWWGKLYEEHGRAVLWDKSGEAHVKKGEWNRYEIEAKGSRIVTRINGETCVDLDDPTGARRGVIALQLHSGPMTEVRFRNFRLQVLD